jgi:hypothetical protein
VDPVPDPLLLRKCGSVRNRTRGFRYVARNWLGYIQKHLLPVPEESHYYFVKDQDGGGDERVYFLFEERKPTCVVLATCPRDRLCILIMDQHADLYVFLVTASFDRVWSSQLDLVSSLPES